MDERARILAMLEFFPPADAREADSLRRIRELAAGAGAPFSREHYVPGHLTASAIVVDPGRQHTLLIFHDKLRLWLQPGGHFEPGESDPNAAAAREVLEETGLAARVPGAVPLLLDVDVHTIPARKEHPEHCHFDLRMLLVAEGTPRAAEVADVKWASPAECAALGLDPGLIRALRKVWPHL